MDINSISAKQDREIIENTWWDALKQLLFGMKKPEEPIPPTLPCQSSECPVYVICLTKRDGLLKHMKEETKNMKLGMKSRVLKQVKEFEERPELDYRCNRVDSYMQNKYGYHYDVLHYKADLKKYREMNNLRLCLLGELGLVIGVVFGSLIV